MRMAQVAQGVLVIMLVLLANSNGFASASTDEVATADTTRNLLTFEDVDPNKQKKHRESIEISPNDEERGVAATVGGAAAGNNVVMPNTQQDGRTVTVTKYHNNGVLQRFKRWWKQRFGSEVQASSTPRLRQRTQ
ncbi:hypothetical protein PHYPSEUDO_011441 [Phytophthora pseudosyringae]|uniref:RxLR effector protein n=1 Tax=Phytophthora pseudosyringae TaxID=221518 RepID=A0A8T1W8D5_9STRA|nr:hypothetical protein PHYPSEUDO_011441 [Phytophthora pseudosyringae]